MRKSKHFRKDVIIARLIALVILIVLIWAISFIVSSLVKPSEGNSKNPESEYSEDQNAGNDDSEDIVPGDSESESTTEDSSESEKPVDSETQEPEERYVRTMARLNLRAEPNTGSTVLTVIEKDKDVLLLEELEGWYKVSFDGKEGYISATYAKIVEVE